MNLLNLVERLAKVRKSLYVKLTTLGSPLKRITSKKSSIHQVVQMDIMELIKLVINFTLKKKYLMRQKLFVEMRTTRI